GPEMLKLAVLEGLSDRLYREGEIAVSGPELEHFVAERLPLLGASDQRQLLEPDAQQLLASYLNSGAQLAARQIARGDYARGLETLRAVEAQIPPSRLGEAGR